jgi:precorrin-6B methylase 1
MVHPPNEILHLLYYDEKNKEMAIREDATEEEKRIFKQFLQDVENGSLSDVEIKFET